MKPERQVPMSHRLDRTDYRDLLSSVFGLMCAEACQIEWLLDRIERAPEVGTWA